VFFEYNITYPPNIPKENEQVNVLRLTRGIIKRTQIVFPRGCAGLVGVRIFRFSVQVIPSNYPAWLDTDGETITVESEIDLMENPYEVEVRGYNLDDTYQHTIRFRFEIVLPEEEFKVPLVEEESERLLARLGEL